MEHSVVSGGGVGYKQDMPSPGKKKTEQILLNLSPDTFKEIDRIATENDRPRGYIARVLMLRGLKLYRQDGWLSQYSPATVAALEEGIRQAIPESPAESERNANDSVRIVPIPKSGELRDVDKASRAKGPKRDRRSGK
jgi:hypothetical protein